MDQDGDCQALRRWHVNLFQLEYGLREPDIDRLSQMADLYGVTVDYLIGRSNQLPNVDLAQNKIDFMYKGQKVPESEMKIVRRLLNSKND